MEAVSHHVKAIAAEGAWAPSNTHINHEMVKQKALVTKRTNLKVPVAVKSSQQPVDRTKMGRTGASFGRVDYDKLNTDELV